MDTAASIDSIFISDYLDEQLVLFLNETTRDGVLKEMSVALSNEGKIHDLQEFDEAILNREKIVSTGIGMGVAIPHAKIKTLSDFFIVVGISPNHGIDWLSLDNLPVHIVFMIGGPTDAQSHYLAILSALTKLIRSKDFRLGLVRSKSEEDVIRFIKNQELLIEQNAY